VTGIATTVFTRLVSEGKSRGLEAHERARDQSVYTIVISRGDAASCRPPPRGESSRRTDDQLFAGVPRAASRRAVVRRRRSLHRESVPRAFRASPFGKPPVDDLRGKIEAHVRRRRRRRRRRRAVCDFLRTPVSVPTLVGPRDHHGAGSFSGAKARHTRDLRYEAIARAVDNENARVFSTRYF